MQCCPPKEAPALVTNSMPVMLSMAVPVSVVVACRYIRSYEHRMRRRDACCLQIEWLWQAARWRNHESDGACGEIEKSFVEHEEKWISHRVWGWVFGGQSGDELTESVSSKAHY